MSLGTFSANITVRYTNLSTEIETIWSKYHTTAIHNWPTCMVNVDLFQQFERM